MFWGITQCNPVNVSWDFGGTYRFRVQGRKVNQVCNQYEECSLLQIAFLLGLPIDSEYGADMFPQIFSCPSPDS
jgi:hypothetical protein